MPGRRAGPAVARLPRVPGRGGVHLRGCDRPAGRAAVLRGPRGGPLPPGLRRHPPGGRPPGRPGGPGRVGRVAAGDGRGAGPGGVRGRAGGGPRPPAAAGRRRPAGVGRRAGGRGRRRPAGVRVARAGRVAPRVRGHRRPAGSRVRPAARGGRRVRRHPVPAGPADGSVHPAVATLRRNSHARRHRPVGRRPAGHPAVGRRHVGRLPRVLRRELDRANVEPRHLAARPRLGPGVRPDRGGGRSRRGVRVGPGRADAGTGPAEVGVRRRGTAGGRQVRDDGRRTGRCPRRAAVQRGSGVRGRHPPAPRRPRPDDSPDRRVSGQLCRQPGELEYPAVPPRPAGEPRRPGRGDAAAVGSPGSAGRLEPARPPRRAERVGPAGGDELRRGRDPARPDGRPLADGPRQPGPVPVARRGRQPGPGDHLDPAAATVDRGAPTVRLRGQRAGRPRLPDHRSGAAAVGVRRRRHPRREDQRLRRRHPLQRRADRRCDVGRDHAAARGVGDAVPGRGRQSGAGRGVPGVVAGPAAVVLRPPRPLRDGGPDRHRRQRAVAGPGVPAADRLGRPGVQGGVRRRQPHRDGERRLRQGRAAVRLPERAGEPDDVINPN